MTISAAIQELEPGAIIELFELELNGETLRFHAGTNELFEPVTWCGNQYMPLPIQAEGFEVNASGSVPRPRLRVANIDGIISQALQEGQDLAGCKVTRRRTLARYLDAVNFPGGNPTADPMAELVPDVFYIDRKTTENKAIVEFELSTAMDMVGVRLPKRQIIQNSCPWEYRSAECGYAGPPVADTLDSPTDDMTRDQCGKRLASCRLRWGEANVLPYGGFPAAGLVRV